MSERPGFARWLQATNTVTAQFLAAGADPAVINLGGGLPDPRFHPIDEVRAALDRAFDRLGPELLDYGPVRGLPALRRAIAQRTALAGRPVALDNVMITTGAMQGLDLVGKVLVDPGELIAAQAPTYLGALDAWRPREPAYRLLDVPSGEAADARALAGAKLLYTVPNFSNPTGALVGVNMRRAILEAAREAGTWLVEDDPYGTLVLDDAPLPRILDLDAANFGADGVYRGPVVYLGTFSKALVPGLRVGWVIAAPAMIEALAIAKQAGDLATSALAQGAALELLESGAVERHTPILRDLYRRRRDAICVAAERHLRPWFDWSVPSGGMFLWLRARDPGFDTDRLHAEAAQQGVILSPSSVFDPTGRARGALRVNFTLNDEARLAEGIARLARVAQNIAAPAA